MLQCYGNSTYLPCFANITGQQSYGVFNIYANAACTQFGTIYLSESAGSISIIQGQCQPFELSTPGNPPFVLVNCTAGAESFRLYSDKNCTQLFPGTQAILLNQQCNSFGLIPGSYISGTCQSCPIPVPPPPSSSGGLSGGAIAGIVIGSVAGLAAIGGLAYLLTRKKTKPSPDLPLEPSEPVTTVKEVSVQNPVDQVGNAQPVASYVAPVVGAAALGATAGVVASNNKSDELTPYQSADPVTYSTTTSVPQSYTTTSTIPTTVEPTPVVAPITQYQIGSQYTCAGSYVATKPSELNVALGDFIRIEEVNADQWVRGTNINGQSGWFPLGMLMLL